MSEHTPPDRPTEPAARPRPRVITIYHADTEPFEPVMTPARLLQLMRNRVKYYGAPLPEGYAVPPGIDLETLLKQVPWPPPAGA